MKRASWVITALVVVFFFSCQEVGPDINFSGGGGSDTTGNVDTNQQRIVLIEEFTATNCPNCPKAKDILESLVASYPGRLEIVAVHQGPLSVPLDAGDPEFKTQDGEDLAAYLGPPPYWPCGAIDRRSYEVAPGDFEKLLDRNLWAGYVAQALDSTLRVNLGLEFNYEEASRQLTGSVTVSFLETITDPLNVTILITESGMVATQLDGTTEVPGYVHHDVLRDIITHYKGDVVTGSKTEGSAFNYSIPAYTLPVEWNEDSCRIIAFVSKSAGTYDVLQAMGTPLKN